MSRAEETAHESLRRPEPQRFPSHVYGEAGGDELLTRLFFPALTPWLPLTRRLGLAEEDALHIASLASLHGTDFLRELLASGRADVDRIYRAIADELRLAYLSGVDPERLLIAPEQALTVLSAESGPYCAKVEGKDGYTSYVLVPEDLDQSRASLERHPTVRARLKVTTPAAFRSAMTTKARAALDRLAVDGLAEDFPEFSARVVANAWQGLVLGAAIVAVPVAVTLYPEFAYGTLHILVSFFFLACVGLRIAAIYSPPPRLVQALPSVSPADLPVYSVIVALYGEAEVVSDLLRALDRIVWPRSKLEIKLACETDDAETLRAIAKEGLPPWVEVVRVPRIGPRTKPKALAYALPLTRGDYIVLFDAEDQPHPHQLLEAWDRFQRGGEELACLQAPLEIGNHDQSLIARMFAFEYAGLFRGLLPWLSRRRALLPLGGTSNHFRGLM